MPPKKSGKGAKADDADDDLDAFLNAAAAEALKAKAAHAPEPPAPPAEGDDDGSGDEEDGEGDAGGKKDKKKKKKKSKAKEEGGAVAKAEPAAKPLTAAGKAILERQQRLAEEEARVKKLQEEEERKIREEEEKEAAELRAIEAEKERKRKLKADKVEAQKAAGTYMTKAEKEKAAKTAARLEALKAAGMISEDLLKNKDASAGGGDQKKSQAEMYAAPKKKAAPKPVEAVVEVKVETKDDEDVADDWDADDDWEVKDLSAGLQDAIKASMNIEDELELDNKAEQERLKQLGIERAKREEIERIRRLEEEKEREEMERKEREALQRKENSRKRRNERDAAARAARSPSNLRSPISCIMGHVDTGKTSLLDKIRHTNVQEGEAGGITQQIGATQFSREKLLTQTQALRDLDPVPFDIRLPGLLVIDTPGHESFSNLRSRGSSLCDVAILVIDLMHGLEQQTIESLNMLRKRKCPFVVALNKVDRCYGWKGAADRPIRESLKVQDDNCKSEFDDRTARAILALNEQGLNAKLYWDNDDPLHTVSLVPTSAVTGEGIPDLIMMVIKLTQEAQQEKLQFMNVLQCTVLEVKVVEGLGHTVDVVLVNGTLREGDKIVVSTMEGPVVTQVRALLTPPPNRESRVKCEYVHHQSLQGAIGIKIVATDISRAIAGTSVLVIEEGDDEEDVKEDVQSDLTTLMKALETDAKGVMVHASTLGALEALLQFLRNECKPPIPVSHINIGPIYKKDVMRANIMNEKGQPEFATILAFDVRVDSEAQSMAEENNVRIFTADIIYHLFDQFTAYMRGITESRREAAEAIVQFPCVLKILPQHVFNKKDPIVMGVDVVEGTVKLGTVLCVPSLDLVIGKVISIQNNHREVPSAKKGTSVAIKLSNESNPNIMYGRQFDHTHALYSKISRQSIDALKEYFKEDMTKEDWGLVIKLKTIFSIA